MSSSGTMSKLLIDGKRVPSNDGKSSKIYNPANTSEVVAEVCVGSIEDARRAVDSAYAALSKWSEVTPRARSLVLYKASELLGNSEAEIANTLTREQGKPYPESLNEVRLSASVLRYYAGLAPTISG